MPPTIFTTCQPRPDVLSGATRDEQFMADLSQVVNGTALPDYLDPVLFFRNTYPTRGLRELMKAVCLRLSGKGGEVSPIIRLGTQYGGGKTHGLIALVHAARGARRAVDTKKGRLCRSRAWAAWPDARRRARQGKYRASHRPPTHGHRAFLIRRATGGQALRHKRPVSGDRIIIAGIGSEYCFAESGTFNGFSGRSGVLQMKAASAHPQLWSPKS